MIDLSREYEEKHLRDTLEIIQANVADYEEQAVKLRADIAEMQEHYHDDNPEIWQTLNNTITLYENVSMTLAKNKRAAKKPYFGRIVFTDKEGQKKESLYIGRGGVNKDVRTQIVIDWRAPIANVYYENGLGPCSYTPPKGKDIELDLEVKRTFDIDGDRLTGFFDSSVAANDELLNKYLARNKQAVLSEIVATIQKEQNDIIRKSPLHNVIAQGAAGSGKTTVAMHRISYILYNYPDRIKPSDFYIIGSNEMLLNYITGVLPELDVQGFRQMTMEQLFIRLLYEDWNAYSYAVKEVDREDETTALRGSRAWYEDLVSFCKEYEARYIEKRLEEKLKGRKKPDSEPSDGDKPLAADGRDIILYPLRYVESIKEGKTGVFDRSEETDKLGKYDPAGLKREPVVLMKAAYIDRFLADNPNMSLQNKIDTLNERLTDNLEQELMHKDIKYTAKEKAAIRHDFRNYFGGSELKDSVYKIYEAFRKEKRLAGLETREFYDEECDAKRKQCLVDAYDLAALAYIYKRVRETQVISEAHHIVIDEAQDYGMMAYCVLAFCIKDCTYTIMGDISQNIRYDSGLNDWSDLRSLFLKTRKDSFCTLRKSYRNTIEISDFATGILDHGSFEVYPVEPIIRHGSQPLIHLTDKRHEVRDIAGICRRWQEAELATIAVVCIDENEAKDLAEKLKTEINIVEYDSNHPEFGNGIMVLPVNMTKGLEFDAVLIYNPSRDHYPCDDRHAKLLYVAATRALHELCLVAADVRVRAPRDISVDDKEAMTDDLVSDLVTGLVTDPVDPDKQRRVIADAGSQDDQDLLSQEVRDHNAAYSDEKEDEYVKSLIMKSADTKARKMGIRKVAEAVSDTGSGSAGVSGRQSGTGSQNAGFVSGSMTRMSSGSVGDTASQVVPESGFVDPDSSGGQRARVSEVIDGGRPAAPHSFAEIAGEESFRMPGHSTQSIAVKWVSRQTNGIFLQSRYGVMRIYPISAGMVRISFCKGMTFSMEDNQATKPFNMLKNYSYKEKGNLIEIGLPKLNLSIDKLTGIITYKNGKGKELIREKNPEPRYIDGSGKSILNLIIGSNEAFHAYNPDDGSMKYVRGQCYHVKPSSDRPALLINKDKFGMIFTNRGDIVFGHRPGAGTFTVNDGGYQDMYFVAADSTDEIIEIYNKLVK